MVFISDRAKLEDRLAEIETILKASEIWTPDVSNLFVEREKIKKMLKTMKGDWL